MYRGGQRNTQDVLKWGRVVWLRDVAWVVTDDMAWMYAIGGNGIEKKAVFRYNRGSLPKRSTPKGKNSIGPYDGVVLP